MMAFKLHLPLNLLGHTLASREESLNMPSLKQGRISSQASQTQVGESSPPPYSEAHIIGIWGQNYGGSLSVALAICVTKPVFCVSLDCAPESQHEP